MVPIVAPRFNLNECNSEREREFIEALHARATFGGWYADVWPRPDRIILSVCRIDRVRKCVARTLRVDFDGTAVTFGDDETHQFVTNLDPAFGTIVISGKPVAQLAAAAADWLEQEMSAW